MPEQSHYPNGQLRWQATIKNGKPVGIVRHWYENGTLRRECPYDDEGLQHGVVKNWTKEGKLLDAFEWDHGSGISRDWYENGQLESESQYFRGKLCGRTRIFLEDGDLLSVSYHVNGRKVSKKNYDEACKKDPALPRYENVVPGDGANVSIDYKRRQTPISDEERRRHEEFVQKFLKQPNQNEARQWLAGNENRFIGEMTPEESREYIKKGYKAGATKIIAVEIEANTTNCLIVYLPPSGTKRQRVFEWNSESAQECGFDPDDDWGQTELFAYFS